MPFGKTKISLLQFFFNSSFISFVSTITSSAALETNGHQNYRNWPAMRSYHPLPQALWSMTRQGVFDLDADYYEKSGGLFLPSKHYEEMFA